MGRSAGEAPLRIWAELVAEFVATFQTEWNRLQSDRRAELEKRVRRLADVERRIASLLDAIERGILTPTTKERLLALEAEKQDLLKTEPDAPMPAIHPNLANLYRDKVARLESELNDPEIAADAKSVLTSSIDKIVLFSGDSRGEVMIELHGGLAGILDLAQAQKNKVGSRVQHSVVAGARFDRELICSC